MSVTAAPRAVRVDRFASARLVADAVLYEGYVLYPYRASAQKNQMRWQFGVLAPEEYAQLSGSERSTMRSEVIVSPGTHPTLLVRIRCLQIQHRQVEVSNDQGATFVPADSVTVAGHVVAPWDETIEHEIDLEAIGLLPPADATKEHRFSLPAGHDVELLSEPGRGIVGRALRRREPVDGVIRVSAEWAAGDVGLLKVTISVENATPWRAAGVHRDTAMRRSLIAVHTLLAVDDASFVSLLEPAPFAEPAVAGCRSDGAFPVMIGDEGANDVMLSAPIILYDYPAIAPESAGEFCDSTEIDEILALRVLTLTDDEKAEARATDPRAAAIIDRCDHMSEETWSQMHGALRCLRPSGSTEFEPATADVDASVTPWWDPGQDSSFDPWTDTTYIGGVEVGNGTRVRLHPLHRADAHDLFYADRLATVKGVFNDVDENRHIAVVLDDDPASDELEWQGRFLYFHPDEIEVLP